MKNLKINTIFVVGTFLVSVLFAGIVFANPGFIGWDHVIYTPGNSRVIGQSLAYYQEREGAHVDVLYATHTEGTYPFTRPSVYHIDGDTGLNQWEWIYPPECCPTTPGSIVKVQQTVDLTGDGFNEIIAYWDSGDETPDKIAVYDLKNKELIDEQDTLLDLSETLPVSILDEKDTNGDGIPDIFHAVKDSKNLESFLSVSEDGNADGVE